MKKTIILYGVKMFQTNDIKTLDKNIMFLSKKLVSPTRKKQDNYIINESVLSTLFTKFTGTKVTRFKV